MADDPKDSKLNKILGLIPVFGAAFRGAEGKSEYDVAAGSATAILTIPDCPGWAKAVALGVIAAGYAISRAMKKGAAAAILVFLALGVGGCANSPERDALRRVGDVLPRVADDIHPTDGGGEARKAELLKLAEECRRLGEGR